MGLSGIHPIDIIHQAPSDTNLDDIGLSGIMINDIWHLNDIDLSPSKWHRPLMILNGMCWMT